jgi:capping protein beta
VHVLVCGYVCVGWWRLQSERTLLVSAARGHVENMGSLIEDMEIECRSNLDGLYIQKTREVINSMRRLHAVGGPGQGAAFTMNLNAAVMRHAAGRRQDTD